MKMKKYEKTEYIAIPHPNGGLVLKIFMRCGPGESQRELAEMGILEDVLQEARLVGVVLTQQGITAEGEYKRLCKVVNAFAYDFWKRYGFRKFRGCAGKGASWRQVGNFSQDWERRWRALKRWAESKTSDRDECG